MSNAQNQEAGVSRSSSASLSSPPHTSPEPGSPSAQFANEQHSITVNHSVDLIPPPIVAPQPPARKKPGRKPRVSATDATNSDAASAPKRKPRKLKDPNAPPPRPRKKKAGASESAVPSEAKIIATQPKSEFKVPVSSEPSENAVQIATSQSGKNEAIQTQTQPQPQPQPPPPQPTQRPINSFFNAPPPPQPQQQQQSMPPQQQQPLRSSGQNYDPIRSNSSYDPIRETIRETHNHYPNSQGSPSQPPPITNRASASPSISSLVDPPNQAMTSPSIAAQSFFNQQQLRFQRDEGQTSVPPSPTANRLAPSVMIESSVTPNPPAQAMRPAVADPPEDAPVPVVPKKPEAKPTSGPSTISKKSMANGSTATSSAAASPKPPKLKEAKDTYPTPPPLPGSGLMQLGGMGGGPQDGTEFRAPTVILNIPMAGESNKYINFTRLAEEQYGWDALHPRLAAQRDRLARVAAAGAALERNGSNRESGDEMSLDSDAEGSNVEMGGMSDGRTGTDGGAKKVPRKRKMKEDEYDKDDGFVDDSELLWEEQAAAANDGFFVYSGPLVPEGEKPTLDNRADGAPKRARGRGSRGGTTRGGAGSRGGAAAGAGRGGTPLTGPGSRGGSTTRKPRITKADRARMEQEKIDRAKMGSMTSMPTSYTGNMPHLASAANMGQTPMVFNQ